MYSDMIQKSMKAVEAARENNIAFEHLSEETRKEYVKQEKKKGRKVRVNLY